jgi:hypothetical protein
VAKKDSILAHCLARAVVDAEGGLDATVEKYGEKAERLSNWTALWIGAKVTPKASRVRVHRRLGHGDGDGGPRRVLHHGVSALLERERAPGVPAAAGVPGAVAGVRDAERARPSGGQVHRRAHGEEDAAPLPLTLKVAV